MDANRGEVGEEGMVGGRDIWLKRRMICLGWGEIKGRRWCKNMEGCVHSWSKGGVEQNKPCINYHEDIHFGLSRVEPTTSWSIC